MKKTIWEFIRYGIVGAIATVVDWAVLYVATEYLFSAMHSAAVYPAHVLSFSCGLLVNFLLSNLFVFVSDSQKGKGSNVQAFVLFALIGLVGLGITEAGAWVADLWFGSETVIATIGSFPIKVYLAAKVILTFITFIWNYCARKFWIYDRKERVS